MRRWEVEGTHGLSGRSQARLKCWRCYRESQHRMYCPFSYRTAQRLFNQSHYHLWTHSQYPGRTVANGSLFLTPHWLHLRFIFLQQMAISSDHIHRGSKQLLQIHRAQMRTHSVWAFVVWHGHPPHWPSAAPRPLLSSTDEFSPSKPPCQYTILVQDRRTSPLPHMATKKL